MTAVHSFVRIATPAGPRFARAEGPTALFLDQAPWLGGKETGESAPMPPPDGPCLCPVLPRTLFGIGKNYRGHASEMGGEVPEEPLVFLKATSSLIGPGDSVVLPKESVRVDYEAELGVVIGKRGRRIPRGRALEHVFGLVPLCDVTARDLQLKDGQWARAKSFDTFCPVGPAVVAGVAPGDLSVRLEQNGTERQRARTSDMAFDVARIIEHVSAFTTLEPGDLIATGTPEGIGPLASGDRIAVIIEGVGTLRFGVTVEE